MINEEALKEWMEAINKRFDAYTSWNFDKELDNLKNNVFNEVKE